MTSYPIPETIWRQLLRPNSAEVASRATGGLSASWVFRCTRGTSAQDARRLTGSSGWACLRRWPVDHPSPDRLRLIRMGLQAAVEAGCRFVPEPLLAVDGRPYCIDGKHTWELTTWLDGESNYLLEPTQKKLQDVATKLAILHDTWSQDSHLGMSPACQDRLRRLGGWLQRRQQLRNALPRLLADQAHYNNGDQVAQLAFRSLGLLETRGPGIRTALQQVAMEPVPLHFVIRDIWSDHVLFQGDEVTGIIDFGAARIDEPATDLARLLASLEPRHPGNWSEALKAYGRLATPIDRDRLSVLDVSSALLSALQWLEWLVVEPRKFETPVVGLVDRWGGFVTRLEQNLVFGAS